MGCPGVAHDEAAALFGTSQGGREEISAAEKTFQHPSPATTAPPLYWLRAYAKFYTWPYPLDVVDFVSRRFRRHSATSIWLARNRRHRLSRSDAKQQPEEESPLLSVRLLVSGGLILHFKQGVLPEGQIVRGHWAWASGSSSSSSRRNRLDFLIAHGSSDKLPNHLGAELGSDLKSLQLLELPAVGGMVADAAPQTVKLQLTRCNAALERGL